MLLHGNFVIERMMTTAEATKGKDRERKGKMLSVFGIMGVAPVMMMMMMKKTAMSNQDQDHLMSGTGLHVDQAARRTRNVEAK